MGIRGYIQTRQPEYGSCISSWISHAAYKYLTKDAGLDIYTDDNGEDADHWEIEIPSFERMREIAKNLHEHPDALDKYFCKKGLHGFIDTDDFIGKNMGENLAQWLDEGIEVAEKNGYWAISVDWF